MEEEGRGREDAEARTGDRRGERDRAKERERETARERQGKTHGPRERETERERAGVDWRIQPPSAHSHPLSALSLVDCESVDHLFSPLHSTQDPHALPPPHGFPSGGEGQKPSELGPKAFLFSALLLRPLAPHSPPHTPPADRQGGARRKEQRGGEPKSIAPPPSQKREREGATSSNTARQALPKDVLL